MKAWIDALARTTPSPVGTVVHVGCGGAAVLDDYRDLEPARLVLVDADPQALEALREHAAADPRIELHGAVVAPQAGPVAWHRFTLPALNGPLDRSDLGRYYPRLRRLATESRHAVALADWLAPLGAGLAADHSHWLVLDVPGQEAALLGALPDALLERFEVVLVRSCAAQALDRGEGPQDAARTTAELAVDMAARGYVAVDDAPPDADPLWPLAAWRLDRHAVEVRRLREQARCLHERVRELETAVDAGTAELAALREASAARIADLEVRLQAALAAQESAERMVSARTDELARIDTEHKVTLSRIDTEHQAALSRIDAEHKAQLARLDAARDEQARATADALKSASAQQRRAEAAETAQADTKASLVAAQGRIQALESEMRATSRALNVAVRTQALRENDLLELQERHAQLMAEQRGTQDLLTKLTERLTAAYQYYQQLSITDAAAGAPRLEPARKPARRGSAARGRTAKPAPSVAAPDDDA